MVSVEFEPGHAKLLGDADALVGAVEGTFTVTVAVAGAVAAQATELKV